MGVHRFPRDEQPHDLGGSLEQPVDPPVPEHPLHRVGTFPVGAERIGGLVTASTLDLEASSTIRHPHFGVPQLGDCRFEPDIRTGSIGQETAEIGDGLHGKDFGGHLAQLLSDRVVLADGSAPLHPFRRPGAGDLQRALGAGGAARGNGEPPGIEGDEGELESLALLPQDVLDRDFDVGESQDAVLDRAESHEMEPLHHLDARPGGLPR